jgi:hypothetical protein
MGVMKMSESRIITLTKLEMIVLAIAMAALAVSIMLVAALWIQMGHPL